MILARIIEHKREEIEKSKENISFKQLQDKLSPLPQRRNFLSAITRPHQINLIAEIKKSSPSGGILREKFSPVEIAEIYELSGATAISILTDKQFFGGELSHISQVRQMVNLPILRKDFIIDEYQIYESAAAGSDAFLLICDILSKEELSHFIGLGSELNMDALVEVHSEEDLEKALEADAPIIGINNRNLHSLKVDLETSFRLMRLIPHHKTVVSESGIKSHEDVMSLKSVGINIVLIGEAFMRSEDIGAKVKEIIGHQ